MIGTQGGPSVVRRQLGRRLRRLREQAGKSIEDVIVAGAASRSKMWRIEAGRAVVKQGDVLALARLYGVDHGTVDELLALAEATKATGYLEDYGAAVPQSLGLYADLEASAAAISDHSSELLHGLLQTPDYARAVVAADRTLGAQVIDQRVEFRVERQRQFFSRSTPARLQTVVTAGVMNLVVGSPAVMEAQIAHLRAMSKEGVARISILSATNGVHRFMRGPFVILDFNDPDDPSVAYVESLIGSRYIERSGDVAQFRQAFSEMLGQAVPLEEWLR